MAKKRDLKEAPSQPRRQRGKSTWVLSRSFKRRLEMLPSWPYLKPVDWQPLARREWGLEQNIKRKDARFGLICAHCNNRKRKIKKEGAPALVVDDEAQPLELASGPQ